MPISDEVIELAPVKKTKTQLIILLAVIGVCVALAVTFLVLYLLKPNVDENPIVVNAVTITGNDLYAQTEGEETKYYASIGNEYIVYANISVEKETSAMLKWEVSPAGAVTEVERTELSTTDAETGETTNAYFKFIPSGAHNTDVTVKVRSAADVNKSAEFTFKIVNAVTHSIVAKQYQPSGGAAVDIVNNTINIPYYKTDIRNNKTYYMSFDQFGKYNERTEKYLPLTVTGTGDSASNIVSVSSSDERIISVQYPNANSFSFKAEGKTGPAVITITANVNANAQSDAPSDPVTCQVTVNVEDNITLGYIENIYFFDKGVVNEEFIESILDNTRNRIDPNKLTVKVREDGLKMNEEFVMPYGLSYTDIFSHILVAPVDIQYDIEERTMKTDWRSKITVTATGDALNVSNLNGTVTLRADGLASNANGATACKMTLTDNTVGGLRSKVDVNVNIVAQNTTGTVGATAGSVTYTETQPVPIAPEGEATFTVVYTHKMPGRTDAATVLERKYLNSAFMLDFDPDVFEVHIAGINNALEPGEQYNLTSNAITVSSQGTETASSRDFLTTVTLSVRIKSGATDGASVLKFIKVGSAISATEDWPNECTWEKAMTFNVTRRATTAYFVGDASAKSIVTNNGARLASFQVTNDARTNAVIYVQNMMADRRFDSLFNILDLVDADATVFTAKVTSIALPRSGGAFARVTPSPMTDPNYNKLEFRGEVDCNAGDEQAGVTITVYAAGDVELPTKLTVSIHVFDAVKSFVSVERDPVNYNGNSASHSYIEIRNSDVKVIREFKGEAQYTFNNKNVHLYLGSTASVELTPSETSPLRFSHEGTELFIYSNGRLIPQTDLYVYAYNYNRTHEGATINVSDVVFEVRVNNDEFYKGDEIPALTVACSFVRLADGLAVYEDEQYSNKIGEVYPVNQSETARLYVSSLVTIDGQPVVVSRYPNVGTVQRSYVILPGDLVGSFVSGGRAPNIENSYYYVSLKVPQVSGAENINDYTVTFEGGATDVSITLRVQNFARPVSSITICSDSAGTTEIASSKTLNFGKYLNEDISAQTVYIKVTYATAAESHMYYESVLLTLPKYLTVREITSDNIVTSEESVSFETYVDSSNYVVYRITPSSSGVQNDNSAKIFRCDIALASNAQSQSGKLTLDRQFASSGLSAAVERNVYIGTGLSGIDISKTGNDNDWSNIVADPANTTDYNFVTVSHTFALKDATANENDELVLYLNYNALTKDSYPGIKYDATNLDITSPTVAGLVFDTTGKNTSVPCIRIAVDKNNLQILSGTYSLVFRDTANGATDNNVFTVHLDLNVTMDIYSLAFGNGGDEFAISTTGIIGGSQTATVSVVYNEGKNEIRPAQSVINGVNVASVVKQNADGSYTAYIGNDVKIETAMSNDKVQYTLRVSDTIMSADDFYVCLGYGTLTPVYRKIAITTKSHRIELVQNDNTVPVGNNAAIIEIERVGQKFSLPVQVINNGTNDAVDLGSGKAVVYGIYASQSDYTDAGRSSLFTIANDGTITAGTLTAVSGTVYYRAHYTDSNVAGDTMDICVAITYKLAVKDIALSGIDNNTWKDNKLTLYYKDSGNYTSLDLDGYISVSNAYNVGYTDNKLNITITSNSTDNLVIDSAKKTLLIPKLATGDEGITLEISVSYDNTTAYTKQFAVVVKHIDALELNAESGTINAFTDSALTVTPAYASYNGLTAGYSLTAPDNSNLDISGVGNVKTVAIDDRQSATHGSSYDLTAELSYTLNGGSSLVLVGAFNYTAAYTVNIGGEYVPAFKVYCDADEIAAGSQHIIGSGAYTLSIDNTHGYDSATYTATASGVVSFTATAVANVKTVGFRINESGSVTIAVEVNAYGKKFTNSASYTFLRGADASAKLYVGATSAEVSDKASIVLEYTSAAPTYQYRIANLGNGVADVVVGGATKVEKNADSSVVTITVEKPTTVTVGGTVTIGGTRTVYLTPYTVTFTATEPDFALTADAETVKAGGKVNFSVAKAVGNTSNATFTTAYAVVDGGATINASTGELTAMSTLTSDRTVTVRATVTVNSGAYKGAAYTYYKTITVLGVPLPTIGWKQAETTIAVGGSVTLSTLYEKVDKVSVGSGEHTYALSVSIGDAGDSLTKGTDYIINSSTLKINSTDKTKAGGSITLTIGAKVGGTVGGVNYNADALVTRETIKIIITPEAKPIGGVIVGNAAGTYDISGVATVNSTTTTGNFVSEEVAAGSKVVALSLKNSTDSTKFAVSGSTITLKQDITTETQVDLIATVEIVGGVYNGIRVSCDTTVTVKIPTIKSGASSNIVWNGTGYNTVSDVANRIALPETATGATINVVASNNVANDDKYASVTNNNTASPSISFDRNSNLVLSAAGGTDKNMMFTYTVTLSNGHKYVLTDTFALAAVNVTITTYIGDEQLSENTVDRTVGDSFAIRYAANNGFTVGIRSVAITDNSGIASTALTATFGGERIMFGAASTATGLNVNVAYVVGETEGNSQFAVNISALTSNAAYTIGENNSNTVAVGESGAVTSLWTAQTNFYYPDTLNVAVANGGSLSTYVSSIIVADGSNSNIGSVNLTNGSFTFPTNYGYRVSRDSFMLVITYKTSTASSCNLNVSLLTYNGYRGNSSSQQVNVGYSFTVIADMTVTFDKNTTDNSATVDKNTITVKYNHQYGENGALATATRTGYADADWYDGNGNQVTAATLVEMRSDHTLYARWTAKQVTVQFDSNGGSGVSDKEVVFDGAYGNLGTPTKAGHRFDGWYTAANGGSRVFETTTVKNATMHTLYAHWTANLITVSFYDNSALVSTKAIAADATSYGTLPTITRTGYTLKWMTSTQESAAEVQSSSALIAAADHSLYAKWTANTVTVSYNSNGGGANPGNTTAMFGETYGTLANAPTAPAGHTFAGWWTAEIGGTQVTTTTTVTSENHTLYAHWTLNKVPVTLRYNDGTSNAYTTQIDYGTSFDLHTVINPTRTGHTFAGWWTAADDTGTQVTAAIGSVTADMLLYAHWTENPTKVTVTLYANDDTNDIVYTAQVDYNTSFDLHTVINPTRSGHTFAGWQSEDGSTQYASTIEHVTEDINMYAHWTENEPDSEEA